MITDDDAEGMEARRQCEDLRRERDDAKLDRDHPIQDFLEELNVGDEIALSVLRDGKEFQAKVTLAERK